MASNPISNIPRPSLKPASMFDATDDCHDLMAAMKGLGTDEEAIISVICQRTSAQRQELIKRYQDVYKKDLIKNFEGEISWNFLKVIKDLMTPPEEFLAREAYTAMKGLGTDERMLLDILCTHNSSTIKKIKEAYEKLYKHSIEDDLRGDLSGYLLKLMDRICAADREDCGAVSHGNAPALAQKLYDAGEKKIGTDEMQFIRIFTKASFDSLKAIFLSYFHAYGRTIHQAIDAEFSGWIKTALHTIAEAAENCPRFFAKAINESLKSMMGNKRLIHIVVSRCEIDMENIKEEYHNLYQTPLVDHINTYLKDYYYKRTIVTLVEGRYQKP